MVESGNKIKEIGGYFELADTVNFSKMPFKGVALNTCRNALEYIILNLSYIKRVFVPYFTCEAIVEPLKRLCIDYIFYHINERLEIADEFDLEDGDFIIVNNYFGVKDAYIADIAVKYGEKLIIDNAQALFAPVHDGIKAIYSTRKFVGVADGGFAVGVPSDYAFQFELDDTSQHDSHLYIRKHFGAEAGFKEYQANELKLDNQPVRRLSSKTLAILSQIDYKSVIEKRRQNYNFINDLLAERNFLKLPSIDSFACPMVYPFYTRNKELKSELIKNKIFVATYWPNVLQWCDISDVEFKLTSNIIAIPIDHRYSIDDMKYIYSILNNLNR